MISLSMERRRLIVLSPLSNPLSLSFSMIRSLVSYPFLKRMLMRAWPDWSSAHHRGRRRGGREWARSRQWQRAAATGSGGAGEAPRSSHECHPKEDARRNRRTPHNSRVKRSIKRLHKGIEVVFGQKPIQRHVERVAGRLRQLPRGDKCLQLPLPVSLPKSHPSLLFTTRDG